MFELPVPTFLRQYPDPTPSCVQQMTFLLTCHLFSRGPGGYDTRILHSHDATLHLLSLRGFCREAGLGFPRTLPSREGAVQVTISVAAWAGLTVNYLQGRETDTDFQLP